MSKTGDGGYASSLKVPLIEISHAEDDEPTDNGPDGVEAEGPWEGYDDLAVPSYGRPRSLSVRSDASVVSVLTQVFPGMSTVTASSFTFTNFIIQPANPANLPQACQQAGLAVFPVLVFVFGVINCFTCDLLAEAIAVVGPARAVGLAELLSNHFGRSGWHAGAWSVILANFGALVFTVILIGDMITPLVGLGTGDDVLCSDWLWIVLVSGAILSPMALIKNMSQLDEASQVAVSILITLVLSLIGYAIYLASEPSERSRFGDPSFTDACTVKGVEFPAAGGTYHAGPTSLTFFSAFSNLAFSFNAQANVFPLYAELKERSPSNMKIVNKRAMVMSGVIFTLSGMFGYIAFLDATKGNSVQNFPVKGDFGYFMDAVRLLLAISLVTSYPLTLWECRSHLEQMIANEKDTDQTKDRKRFAMSMVLIVLSAVIAIVAKDVSVIFGFFGATACPILMFVLPTLNHLKMHRPAVKQQVNLPLLGAVNWTGWQDYCALAVFLISMLIIPLALYAWAVFTL
eukprot:m.370256 g.370256  ORF g.370256 m.370256 type:complete len:515 (-) comp16680_c1_seq51:2775-4319(-)